MVVDHMGQMGMMFDQHMSLWFQEWWHDRHITMNKAMSSSYVEHTSLKNIVFSDPRWSDSDPLPATFDATEGYSQHLGHPISSFFFWPMYQPQTRSMVFFPQVAKSRALAGDLLWILWEDASYSRKHLVAGHKIHLGRQWGRAAWKSAAMSGGVETYWWLIVET